MPVKENAAVRTLPEAVLCGLTLTAAAAAVLVATAIANATVITAILR